MHGVVGWIVAGAIFFTLIGLLGWAIKTKGMNRQGSKSARFNLFD